MTEVGGLPTIVRIITSALHKEKSRVEQRRAKANIPVIL